MIRLADPVSERDHARGPATARLTLVEYGDFECPHCGHAFPVLAHVRRAFGPNLRFVFRHFPLRASHPHAGLAAEEGDRARHQAAAEDSVELRQPGGEPASGVGLAHLAHRLGRPLGSPGAGAGAADDHRRRGGLRARRAGAPGDAGNSPAVARTTRHGAPVLAHVLRGLQPWR